MMIDIHAHILPAVDDGAKSFEEAISMLTQAVSQGVTHQILTPHVQSSVSKVDPSQFLPIFESLKAEVKRLNIPIELYLGAEVSYRSHLDPDYTALTLNHSNYILIEFSPTIESPIEDVVYNLKRQGFQPIVAHIERYIYLSQTEYVKIKQAGGMLQINADALLGQKDRHQKKLCHFLLKEQLVDFIATDCHSESKRPPNLKEAYDFLKKLIHANYLEDIFYHNAYPIISK